MNANATRFLRSVLAVVSILATVGVSAQSIQRVPEPFLDKPALPFAPAVKPATPVAPIAPEPPPGQAPRPQWDVAVADVSLLNTFKRWAVTAGYRIKWDALRHVLVEAPGVVTGTFEEALEQVLSSPGIRNSDYPLEVCFYPNSPPLARITRRGEQVKDCI
ncbi:MAG: TcpQ domain-containing protein [Burkholderiaceae bacterium]|nr:TcpQ domain-containing protein [Burkholderiaceae bacterium]MDP3135890.1 TcpQ domain-containing protein [Burkholderiaceae bacterium]